MKSTYNKLSTRNKQKTLRNNPTPQEQSLWQFLKSKQLGVKFRRQHGIGEYIADFYSPEIKLVVEIDGNQHYSDDGIEYDKIRTKFFESLEIKVIRFTNYEVDNNIYNVIDKIKDFI